MQPTFKLSCYPNKLGVCFMCIHCRCLSWFWNIFVFLPCLVTSCFILNTNFSSRFRKLAPPPVSPVCVFPDHLKCFHLIPLDPHVYIVFVFPCLVASVMYFHVCITCLWKPENLDSLCSRFLVPRTQYLILYCVPWSRAILLQRFLLLSFD